MKKPTVIHVTVSVPLASGKTAFLSKMEEVMRDAGLVVASPELERERRIGSAGAEGQLDVPRDVVYVLSECCD